MVTWQWMMHNAVYWVVYHVVARWNRVVTWAFRMRGG